MSVVVAHADLEARDGGRYHAGGGRTYREILVAAGRDQRAHRREPLGLRGAGEVGIAGASPHEPPGFCPSGLDGCTKGIQPTMDHEPMFASMVCSSTRQPTVIRFRWTGAAYEAVGASKQRPGSVLPPGGGLHSALCAAGAYAGCPYCGADNFVHCGRCKELSCHDGSWATFHCPRCGNSGPGDS